MGLALTEIRIRDQIQLFRGHQSVPVFLNLGREIPTLFDRQMSCDDTVMNVRENYDTDT